LDKIAQPYRLQSPGLRHHRLQGQGRQTAHKRTSAICRASDDNGRPQDDPFKVARHQGGITLTLALRKGCSAPIDA
jgi:hypothetical protein